ncbi:MAG: hypothetical protein ACKVOP_08425 [Sphingomonadaceae bacterium]
MRYDFPIIVSIATVPSRIAHLKPTIESLLAGALVPDQIIITHPEFCEWEGRGYEAPEFLIDPAFCGTIVRRVISPQDWGSGTKLLGSLHEIPDNALIILADDDVAYHPRFVQTLVEAHSATRDRSFSFYVELHRGLVVGQGCDGISLWKDYLTGVEAFVRTHVAGTTLRYHDDLWLRFFLLKQSVSAHKAELPPGERLIYTQLVPNDVLSAPKDPSLARHVILDTHFERMLRVCAPSNRAILEIRLRALRHAASSLVSRAINKLMPGKAGL